MLFKPFFFFILLVASSFLQAQNLVPNPSFEDTVTCPNRASGIISAQYWSSYRSSPDYYHRCCPTDCSIPFNSNGYQETLNVNDNGYCGLITYLDFLEYREFLGAALESPCTIGKKYFVSMKVALANSSNWATDGLGVRFSTTSYADTGDLSPSPVDIDNYAHVFFDEIVEDSVEWKLLSGSFIADSAYQFISLGNFFNDSATHRTHIGTLDGVAYYYVDEVCVSEDSLVCQLSTGLYSPIHLPYINVYPNPADNVINISISQQSSLLKIYDVLGKEIYFFNQPLKKDLQINTSNFSSGIYFLQVQTKSESHIVKFFIQ